MNNTAAINMMCFFIFFKIFRKGIPARSQNGARLQGRTCYGGTPGFAHSFFADFQAVGKKREGFVQPLKIL
jgi:hypothetical protein